MLYNKGDIIQLWNDDLAIVLRSEVCGEQFYKEYGGKRFNILLGDYGDGGEYMETECNPDDRKYVWHQVLVGDKKVWLIIDGGDKVIKV